MAELLFDALLDKYLVEDITEEETQTFFRMLEIPACQEQLRERIGQDLLDRIYDQAEDAGRRERIREGLLRQMNEIPETPVIPMYMGRRRSKGWFVAAVAILLLGVGSYWFYMHRPAGNVGGISAGETQARVDMPPGGNKAVLTLANGSTIVLDNARNGTVAEQGSTKVVKTGDGKLAYDAVNAASVAIAYNTLSTPRGGQYQLVLPDGTMVWLNAASTITYPTAFSGAERKVTIVGEAYLEVAKNVSKPFKVAIAGRAEVEVLGTSFNVNAYPDEPNLKATLLEGAVRIMGHADSGKQIDKSGFVLKPGQQAQVSAVTGGNGGQRINVLKEVNTEEVLAWKNGRFSFHGADLQTVMRQLARWYDVEVSYEGKIPEQHFSGRIGRMLTLDQVLKTLTNTGVHYQIEPGNKLIIRP